jgi:hypothetical protein
MIDAKRLRECLTREGWGVGRRRESNTTDTKRAMKRERVVEEREGVNLRVGGAMLSPLSHSHALRLHSYSHTIAMPLALAPLDMNNPLFFFSFISLFIHSTVPFRLLILEYTSRRLYFHLGLLARSSCLLFLSLCSLFSPCLPYLLSPTFFPVPFTPPWPFVLFLG